MADLQVLNGPLQWQTLRVNGPRFMIGRKESCHLVLKDGWISREHSVIVETSAGEFMVQDLDSENGIFVNGVRVTESPLSNGDILRVGRTEMRFVIGNPTGILRTESTVQDGVPKRPLNPASVTVAAPLPGADLELTMHSGGEKGPRTDLRDRVRRLEDQLLKTEQDHARLAAENAVLKRALASAGLLDRTTGQIDLQKLRSSTPSPVVVGQAPFQVMNPLSRGTLRGPRGKGVTLPEGGPRPETAEGILKPGILGVGKAALPMVTALSNLGRRAALIVEHGELPTKLPLHVPVANRPWPGSIRSSEGPVTEFREKHLGIDRDFHLLVAATSEAASAQGLLSLIDLLAEENLAPSRARQPASCILVRGRGSAAATLGANLESVLASGRVGSIFLVDEALAISHSEEMGDGFAATAAALAAGLRLPMLTPRAGRFDSVQARNLWTKAGLGTIGIAATSEISPAALTATLPFAFGDGLMSTAVPPSRAREAWVMVVVGAGMEIPPTSVSEAISAGLQAVRAMVPQARLETVVYQDGGRSLRVFAWLGGLPMLETLGN